MKNLFTNKRIIVTLSALLLAVLGAAGTVGYLTFVRSPTNASVDACADGRPQAEGQVVVAAGASMVQGTLGHDWVDDLRQKPAFRDHEFVNAGDNGNTSADLLERVDSDIVACGPDRVAILVGANDVRDGVPLNDYRDNLRAIVDRIRDKTSARIALMSLPPLGENLEAEINHKLRDYNTAIKDTATHAKIDYVPVNERFTDRLKNQNDRPAYNFSFPTSYLAATKHYLLGHSWDDVAQRNGLELLVDHIHLSDRGGAIVTELATDWLSGDVAAARR
ncbi:SGNH/GDSL hydrolase family protein [Streptomyces sp. NPDC004111]|uniref:SGNH/GDSL hydrolase family protein n=1 Tax=Streptomyces sp. NPDC004111 TaxID=3364690 RepID=UPI0036C3CFB4